MPRIRISLTAAVLVCASGLAHAGIENAGTTAGNFLSVGTGAAVLSMGGATLGSGSDLAASAWNPAALGSVQGSQFTLSHATLAMQTSQDWIAAAGRMGRDATRWSASLLYQSDGGFDGRDAFGASTGSFSVSNMAAGLHAARPFGNVTLGAGFQWVSEHLGDATGSGLGFDAGLKAQAGAFGFGAAARNLGGKMKYTSGSFDMPSVFGVGASWSNPASGVRLALDANFPKAYYQDVRMGAEWMWQNRVALRAGYRLEMGAPAGEPLGGPSFGMGAGANNVWVDYAFLAGNADAQGQHRFGLTFRPGFLNRGLSPMSESAHNPRANAALAARAPLAGPPAVEAPAPKSTPAPAPARVMTPPAPAAAPAQSRPEPARAPEPPAPTPLQITVPDGALAANTAPRLRDPNSESLAPSKPVRVERLAVPTPAPVEAAKPVLAAATKPAHKAAVVRPAESKPAVPLAVVTAPPVAPVVADSPAPTAPVPAPTTEVASTRPGIEVVVVPQKPAAVTAPPARPASVVIKSGETLAVLAKRYGTSVAAIMMENNLVSESVKPGRTIKLPKN